MASPASDAKIEDLKNQIYAACIVEEPETVFRQQDILDLGLIPDNDAALLLAVTQRLVDEKLFKMVRDGQLGWMYRSLEDAQKYKGLTHEQEIVYSLIEESGVDGLWSKTIKTKSGLHDTLMRAALKSLETKRLISEMKNVEYPTRKMYIKSTLRPSEKATGGAWYTDNELDEAFIEGVTTVLFKYIEARSFYKSTHSNRRQPKKTIKGMTTVEAQASRSAAFEIKTEHDDSNAGLRAPRAEKDEGAVLLPLPPTYRGYPSLQELTLFIERSQISTQTTLTPDDISALLDILIFDRRIEKIMSGPDGIAYKALRKPIVGDETVERMNGLTEAPCGRCPVFELCEEGGPVNPSTCVYFKQWLGGENIIA
jgi:DNA-directed RNA polymerase III subunit RPC6